MPPSPALHPQNQRQHPTRTGSPQEPEKSLVVEMTRGGTRGKVLSRLLHRSSPHWEIPQQTRGAHIPTATTTTGYRRLNQHQTKINTNNKTKVVYTDNLTHPIGSKLCSATLDCIAGT